MKATITAAILAAFAASASAWTCDNGAKDWPTCTPPVPTPVITPVITPSVTTGATTADQSQKQRQQQTQQASATAGSATGGAATATNGANTATNGANTATSGPSSSTGTNDLSIGGDSSNSRSWSLVLPPLAFTPPMAPLAGCAPEVTQEAKGILFGAYSDASGHTDPQDCTLLALRNAMVGSCRYASAKQVEDLMVAKKLPGYQPSPVVYTDYTPQECALLKTPAPSPVVNYVRGPDESKPAAKPKPRSTVKRMAQRPAMVCIESAAKCAR